MERADTDAIDGAGPAHDVDHGARQRRVALLHLDDDPRVRQRVAAPSRAAARRCPGRETGTPPSGGEAIAGVDRAPARGGPRAHRARRIGGAIERRVVNDHRHAVAREVHVAFDAVAAERQPALERRQRVLGRQLRAAAMRKDQAARTTRIRMADRRPAGGATAS